MFDKLRTYFEKQFPITDEQFDFMKALFTPKKVLTSYKTTTFFVSPNIGYFVIPKLVGGLRLNVSLYKQNTAVLYSDKYFSLAIFTILFALPKAKVQRSGRC